VDDLVQAKHKGFWYNAKVIGKSGRGANVAATVKYSLFAASHNEKFFARHGALRVRLPTKDLKAEERAATWGGRTDGLNPDGTWEIEALLESKVTRGKVLHLVRWSWAAILDAWEHDLTKDKIECAYRLLSDVMAVIGANNGGNAFKLPHGAIRKELRDGGWYIRIFAEAHDRAISWRPDGQNQPFDGWHACYVSLCVRKLCVLWLALPISFTVTAVIRV
jgi:hypothetical protein